MNKHEGSVGVSRIARAALITLLMTTAASAETMRAVRKGLLCERADALAWLTLPDGSSRTSNSHSTMKDFTIKQSGGCIDIPDGALVQVQNRRKNTSIVRFEYQGAVNTYVTPNIDYTDVTPPAAIELEREVPSPQPLPRPLAQPAPQPAPARIVPNQNAPGITGVRLGMTLLQAEAIIGRGYTYKEQDPASLGITASPDVSFVLAAKNQPDQRSGTDRSLDDYAFAALKNRLFFVERGQSFAQAEKMDLDALRKSLIDLYGAVSLAETASDAGSATVDAFWFYSANDDLLSPSRIDVQRRAAACRFNAAVSVEQGNAALLVPTANDEQELPGSCVHAHMQTEPAAAGSSVLRVARVVTYLFDQAAMHAYLQALQRDTDTKRKAIEDSWKAERPN